MTTLTATKAGANFYKLIDYASTNHEPAVITGKCRNSVLLAEGDWKAISDPALLYVPDMWKSIIEGAQETIEETSTDLEL